MTNIIKRSFTEGSHKLIMYMYNCLVNSGFWCAWHLLLLNFEWGSPTGLGPFYRVVPYELLTR